MTQDVQGLTVVPSPFTPNHMALRVNQLQGDFLSMARLIATDEVGAAIAHELNEPLTALLLYLQAMTEKEGASGGVDAPCSLLEKALCEAQRICDIMRRVGPVKGAPVGCSNGVHARTGGGRGVVVEQIGGEGRRGTVACDCFPSTPPDGTREGGLGADNGRSHQQRGAPRLGISKRTFEAHRANIMEKLGAKNAADLVRVALSAAR